MQSTSSEFIELRESSIHNTGIFAAKDIPKGTRLIEYVGEKVTKAEALKRVNYTIGSADESNGAVYIFELNKKYDIDGNVPYNTARYINHSCSPNCEVTIIRGRLWVSSIRRIKKGEEITYNYGYDMDCYEDHPCKCGSPDCVGYIVAEEHHNKVKRHS